MSETSPSSGVEWSSFDNMLAYGTAPVTPGRSATAARCSGEAGHGSSRRSPVLWSTSVDAHPGVDSSDHAASNHRAETSTHCEFDGRRSSGRAAGSGSWCHASLKAVASSTQTTSVTARARRLPRSRPVPRNRGNHTQPPPPRQHRDQPSLPDPGCCISPRSRTTPTFPRAGCADANARRFTGPSRREHSILHSSMLHWAERAADCTRGRPRTVALVGPSVTSPLARR